MIFKVILSRTTFFIFFSNYNVFHFAFILFMFLLKKIQISSKKITSKEGFKVKTNIKLKPKNQ